MTDDLMGDALEQDPEANYSRGRYLCLRREWEMGLKLLRRAAHGGHMAATFELGFYCLELDNPEEAAVWFQAAAESGDVEAAYFAGIAYARILNLDLAKHWLMVAADQGHADAEHYLDMLRAD